MLKATLTHYGLNKINETMSSPGFYLNLKKIECNHASAELPIEDQSLTKLPLGSIEGYINDIRYDPAVKGVVVQGVIPKGLPEVQINGVGVYDNKDMLVAYVRQTVPTTYMPNSTIRYFFWFPVINVPPNWTADKFNIVLPESQIVNQTYSFIESNTWIIKHKLFTPFVQFKLYDTAGQMIKESEYIATVARGELIISFNDGAIKEGFATIMAEGSAMSYAQGTGFNPSDPEPIYDAIGLNNNIPWTVGLLVPNDEQ